MQLGRETANVMSHIMTESKQPEPKVGDGATVCWYTDRSPGTIIEVGTKQRRPMVVVQEDHATRTDSNGVSDSQDYAYAPNTAGRKWTFTLRKDGRWRELGRSASSLGLAIGFRRKYHDFSF